MKTLYFAIFLFICFPSIAPAQDLPWLEVGSEWTYQHGVVSGPEHFQVTYGITEQTTFAGQPCAKMERISTLGLGCMALEAPYYFYVSNDSLYYATDDFEDFRLAAYFGAEPGDSWEYITGYGENTTSFTATVNSVTTIDVDEITLRRLNITYQFDTESGEMMYDYIYPETMEITEVIGASHMFFVPLGHGSACDSETNVTFQCFESPSFSYLNPIYPSCNYVVGVEESGSFTDLSVFPNPASSYINIDIPRSWISGDVNVQLYNCTGRLVYEQSSALNQFPSISVEHLPKGFYLLNIRSGTKRGIAKVVVE